MAAEPAFGSSTGIIRRGAQRALRIVTLADRVGLWCQNAAARHAQNVWTALVQIWANKARALLTTLGIIIAVTSTITVVSMVQGFGNYMTDVLRDFGTNMIWVHPWRPPGQDGRRMGRVVMDVGDVRAVAARCDKVRRISPLVFTGATVEFGREKLDNVEVQGVTEQFQTIRNFYVDKGRFFGPIDVDRNSYVCLLGRGVMRKLGSDESIVGEHVFINGLRFRVLGLLEQKGDVMGESQDELIAVPYTTVLKMSPVFRRFLMFILEAESEADVEECALQITSVLRERHGIAAGRPNDFRVMRQDEFLRDFDRVKLIATTVLGAIVGVSLIVGGIGIMNVMLVSVTERTREIGLRKSIGGRRRDIMLQFLTEAVVLAVIGGVAGVAAGYALCAIASMHPSMVPITVPPWVVMLALGFSAAVGIVFGLIPAFKAAIIHPIDALRHE